MDNQKELQNFLKNEVKSRSLSLRELSKLTDIDHATLSKIINGKRTANLNHLKKLSESFGTELEQLLKMAGFTDSENDELKQTWKAVQKVVHELGGTDEEITYERVNQEIEVFKKRSQTISGKEKIRKEFKAKMEKTSGIGKYIDQLKAMYCHFLQGNGHPKDQILIGAALLYFIVTTDLLPDYLLPVGLLDDAFIVQAISQRLENKNILL
ncbi:helix-turn-helix domain-containing protein [Jeotgalicoccus halotolerans]|uniref:Helix-turn-helix domain-containing protein n=1 Tax=Jeotgalicoccus nanhaiensis TaxID=568603 RepID=A0ABR9XXU8_9STAP|nr:helix-turn-helix domain-containing protein [Jeotgalicoccus nanhaiensis]MBF0753796.1 helix-turn-helix domain-containing protein [Jeotgalicoccus nanhaiensis]